MIGSEKIKRIARALFSFWCMFSLLLNFLSELESIVVGLGTLFPEIIPINLCATSSHSGLVPVKKSRFVEVDKISCNHLSFFFFFYLFFASHLLNLSKYATDVSLARGRKTRCNLLRSFSKILALLISFVIVNSDLSVKILEITNRLASLDDVFKTDLLFKIRESMIYHKIQRYHFFKYFSVPSPKHPDGAWQPGLVFSSPGRSPIPREISANVWFRNCSGQGHLQRCNQDNQILRCWICRRQSLCCWQLLDCMPWIFQGARDLHDTWHLKDCRIWRSPDH